MAYPANPFLERMSERTTSDQEFVRLFSPKILDKLEDDVFDGAVTVFSSAPGAGKTTLLRAFTPAALRAFTRAQSSSEIGETFRKLNAKGIVSTEGPQLLGVYLSCASGYADLPPGSALEEGLFRALLDCRIVLRTLRSLAVYLGYGPEESLEHIKLVYQGVSADLQGIPKLHTASELVQWAEKEEKRVYSELDAFSGSDSTRLPAHERFEGVLWLQAVTFTVDGQTIAPRRLLMIDDAWKLRLRQRKLLTDELTVLRPAIPVWLSMRNSVLGTSLLSEGARFGRDLRHYTLEDMWGGTKGPHQFAAFAQNILDRRMQMQTAMPGAAFSQCLREQFEASELRGLIERGVEAFSQSMRRHLDSARYSEILERARQRSIDPSLDTLLDLYVTQILVSRDAAKKQMTLELALSPEEIEERDTSQVRSAAEIFLHEEVGLPYYFGFERLCVLATNNIEELLSLAAALYVGVQARQVLRKREPELPPSEQEQIVREAAHRKLAFVPKSHAEGTRARRLLESIGNYCRERTFLPTAPYAPGVTGVRLSDSELSMLQNDHFGEPGKLLLRVLAECSAENLLVVRRSSATTGREPGSVFYLNRTLCIHFGLPLQMGGWQDVTVRRLVEWMSRGRANESIGLEFGR